MYKSPIGEQVDVEVSNARLQLAALGMRYPDVPWTGHEVCLSARQDSNLNPSAFGLALHSMIEDGSCLLDEQTGIVTFPTD